MIKVEGHGHGRRGLLAARRGRSSTGGDGGAACRGARPAGGTVVGRAGHGEACGLHGCWGGEAAGATELFERGAADRLPEKDVSGAGRNDRVIGGKLAMRGRRHAWSPLPSCSARLSAASH